MTKRANDIMAILKSALKLELPSFILTESVSPTLDPGAPTLVVSADVTPATQEEVAFIRISAKSYAGFPTSSLAVNDSGCPHVIQVAVEAETGLATQVCWSAINYSKLISRLKDANCEIELYIAAAGNDAVEADITSSLLVGVIRADVRHANAGN